MMSRTLSTPGRGLLEQCMALARGYFAQRCLLCDAPSGADPICAGCSQDLPRLPAHCPGCALPSAGNARCGACLRDPPPYDRTLAAWAYEFPANRLVHALKFHARLELAPWLGRELAGRLERPPDLIVPVPLHRSRLAQRGFNQAHEIARRLSGVTGIPYAATGVRRVRATAAQAHLTPAARRSNLRRAFECHLALQGVSVAVVDDVMTTGATFAQLARALKRCGAAQVTNVVVARTLRNS
jgi:ComF family protein